MKIGIDISQIVYGTGVSSYVKNLVETLLKIDRQNKYVLFGGALRQKNKLRGQFNPKIYPISPVLADFLWNRLHILPIEKIVGELDVFHSSDWSQPPSRAYKVTTIHDLAPLIFQKQTDRRVLRAHWRRLQWVKKEVDKVIAVSNATKKDIINYLGIPEERIEVIYEAPDPIYQPRSKKQITRTKEKYGITGDYVLSVGTGPRKNLDRIAQAIPKGLQYVMVGRGQLEPSDIELAALYSGAQVFVYASTYEGFGLPILEAYSCGCPVVTSNVSSMPEVAGDGAVLVNPDRVESITKGIVKAIDDRDRLIEKGNLRLKEFSWERTAKETLGVYERIVSRGVNTISP